MKRHYTIEVFHGLYSELWCWHLKAPNGKIIADGAEGYANKGNAVRAAQKMVDMLDVPCGLKVPS